MSSFIENKSTLQPMIPQDFKAVEPQIITGEWADFQKDLGPFAVCAVPVWHIGREKRSFGLRQALMLRIYRDGKFVFAENNTLSICGTGFSVEEAVADFATHTIHFFEYYKGLSESKLTGDAIKLKRLFARLFVEE